MPGPFTITGSKKNWVLRLPITFTAIWASGESKKKTPECIIPSLPVLVYEKEARSRAIPDHRMRARACEASVGRLLRQLYPLTIDHAVQADDAVGLIVGNLLRHEWGTKRGVGHARVSPPPGSPPLRDC
jgi:hypothetical protein